MWQGRRDGGGGGFEEWACSLMSVYASRRGRSAVWGYEYEEDLFMCTKWWGSEFHVFLIICSA